VNKRYFLAEEMPAGEGMVLYTDYQQLERVADEMAEALTKGQWVEVVVSDHGSVWFCSECRNDKKYGHHPECPVAAALASYAKWKEMK
jgi:hypothetical protein